ncbi:MAG: hypothetical protein M1834_007548 [Cirrosporium novae-zelandiae]|nr:MAG: hypothetical protein M1834_007548 [Cirrosporium novae-zelandiae]
MDITTFVAGHRESALLLGDYNSYHQQLSRRLLKVRRKLGCTTPKGRKYTPKEPITSEDVSRNHEYAHLLLLQSERAWAFAMHMKSTHSTETSSITGSTRTHIISKLHQAALYAEQLCVLVKELDSSQAANAGYLEAQAYASSLWGAVDFEKKSWEKCLKHYSTARVIYSVLAIAIKNDSANNLLSNTVEPSIRYAAYQHGLPRTLAIPTIAQKFFPTTDSQLVEAIKEFDQDALNNEAGGVKKGASEQGDALKTISWRSRTVNIEDASIAQCLASVSAAEAQLSHFLQEAQSQELSLQEKAAAYDNVIGCSQDAADATKSAIDELAAEGVASEDQRMQSLQVTRTAVNYAMIEWRVGRNRILCGSNDGALLEHETNRKQRKVRKDGNPPAEKEEAKGKKLARLRERLVLYNGIIQSIDDVKELPGVAADTAFVTELDGKRAYFQAQRCLAIGRSHLISLNEKNALALFAHASDLSKTCLSSLQSSPMGADSPPKLEVTHSHASFLNQLLQDLVCKHHALVEISSLAAKPSNKQANNTVMQSPLVNSLQEYPSDGKVDPANLVTWPPKLTPIPVKPLFFDVAWTYIDYPGRGKNGLEEANPAEDKKDEQKPAQKRGWFGFGRS